MEDESISRHYEKVNRRNDVHTFRILWRIMRKMTMDQPSRTTKSRVHLCTEIRLSNLNTNVHYAKINTVFYLLYVDGWQILAYTSFNVISYMPRYHQESRVRLDLTNLHIIRLNFPVIVP